MLADSSRYLAERRCTPFLKTHVALSLIIRTHSKIKMHDMRSNHNNERAMRAMYGRYNNEHSAGQDQEVFNEQQ